MLFPQKFRACLLVLSGTCFPAATCVALNLTEAYEAALLNDPDIQVARAEYLAGLEAINVSRGALLPQIEATGSHLRRETDSSGLFPITVDGDQDPRTPEIRALRPVIKNTDEVTESWSISLRQMIYDMAEWHRYKRGKFQTEQAKYEFDVQQQELILRVISAYVDVLRAHDDLEISHKLVNADESQLAHSQKRANVGANAQADVYQVQASYDVSIANQLRNEDLLGEAKDRLSLIVGGFSSDLWQLRETFKPAALDPPQAEEWLLAAMQNSPNIKVAEANKNATEAAYKSARSHYLPKFYTEITYNESDINTGEIDNRVPLDYDSTIDGASIAFNLSIPLYSGGRDSALSRQTKFQYEAAVRSYDGTIEETRRRVYTLHRAILSIINRMTANEKAVQSTEKALRAMRLRYDTGIGDVNDLLEAQRAYYNAIRDFNNARYEYISKSAELRLTAGLLSPSAIYRLNTELVKPIGRHAGLQQH